MFFPSPPLFPGFLTIATTSHLLFHGLSGLFLHLYLATSGPNWDRSKSDPNRFSLIQFDCILIQVAVAVTMIQDIQGSWELGLVGIPPKPPAVAHWLSRSWDTRPNHSRSCARARRPCPTCHRSWRLEAVFPSKSENLASSAHTPGKASLANLDNPNPQSGWIYSDGFEGLMERKKTPATKSRYKIKQQIAKKHPKSRHWMSLASLASLARLSMLQPSNHPTIQPSNLRTGGFQALSHLGHRHHTTCHGDIAARPLVSACRARWLYNSQWWPTTTGETGGVSLEHFRLKPKIKGIQSDQRSLIPLSSLSISFQSERGGISAF